MPVKETKVVHVGYRRYHDGYTHNAAGPFLTSMEHANHHHHNGGTLHLPTQQNGGTLPPHHHQHLQTGGTHQHIHQNGGTHQHIHQNGGTHHHLPTGGTHQHMHHTGGTLQHNHHAHLATGGHVHQGNHQHSNGHHLHHTTGVLHHTGHHHHHDTGHHHHHSPAPPHTHVVHHHAPQPPPAPKPPPPLPKKSIETQTQRPSKAVAVTTQTVCKICKDFKTCCCHSKTDCGYNYERAYYCDNSGGHDCGKVISVERVPPIRQPKRPELRTWREVIEEPGKEEEEEKRGHLFRWDEHLGRTMKAEQEIEFVTLKKEGKTVTYKEDQTIPRPKSAHPNSRKRREKMHTESDLERPKSADKVGEKKPGTQRLRDEEKNLLFQILVDKIAELQMRSRRERMTRRHHVSRNRESPYYNKHQDKTPYATSLAYYRSRLLKDPYFSYSRFMDAWIKPTYNSRARQQPSVYINTTERDVLNGRNVPNDGPPCVACLEEAIGSVITPPPRSRSLCSLHSLSKASDLTETASRHHTRSPSVKSNKSQSSTVKSSHKSIQRSISYDNDDSQAETYDVASRSSTRRSRKASRGERSQKSPLRSGSSEKEYSVSFTSQASEETLKSNSKRSDEAQTMKSRSSSSASSTSTPSSSSSGSSSEQEGDASYSTDEDKKYDDLMAEQYERQLAEDTYRRPVSVMGKYSS